MIKAVIFDFDGVIAESVDIKTRSFARLFEGEGDAVVRRVVSYHLRNTGVSRYEKFVYIYKNILKRPLTRKKFDMLCAEFSRLVTDEVIRAPFVRGADEFLKKFHKRYALFVCSATPQREMRKIAREKGISGYFSGIYGAPVSKADIVKKIMRSGRFAHSEIVYVGDALSDYEAASANLVRFIARIGGDRRIFSGRKGFFKLKDMTGLKRRLDAF